MLFHTWAFVPFIVVALGGFYALRLTRLWIPWLLGCSYFFYAQWNPVYLVLIFYSTALDYLLVMLMDHSRRAQPHAEPRDVLTASPPPHTGPHTPDDRPAPHGFTPGEPAGAPHVALQTAAAVRIGREPAALAWEGRGSSQTAARSPVLNVAFTIATLIALALICAAVTGPESVRPTFIAFTILVSLMAIGAGLGSRKAWLTISVINNLALLLFFKYARFAEANLNHVLAWMHAPLRLPDPSTLMPPGMAYVLPVGISFFTFQSMSYTIDFYFGKVERERNFLRFATFVCFFPQLMAGPIERARQMLPQFQNAPPFALQNITDGCSLFLAGLFKKLALANYLAMFVDGIYDSRPEQFSSTTLALATFAFAWQIYFDFSGYTDMARGLARMMGFNLVLNFNHPYLATGLGDFWARWHISLSTWFRDYIYIPLGGNRRSAFVTYRNLFITFLLSGIWHGANWTFAVWGSLHAVGVMLTRGLERSAAYRNRVPRIVKQAWVFLYVCFAWIFFRAGSLDDALTIVRRIFVGIWSQPQMPALMAALVGAVWMYEAFYESRIRPILQWNSTRVVLATAMIVYLGICSTRGEAFIYFQF